jgi:hypothetical protein
VIRAPGLREVAEVRWDVERDPAVVWDDTGRHFELVDPADPAARLDLATFAAPVADPARVAAALAEGLASCDFPPTGDTVAPGRAALALRAAGVRETPAT